MNLELMVIAVIAVAIVVYMQIRKVEMNDGKIASSVDERPICEKYMALIDDIKELIEKSIQLVKNEKIKLLKDENDYNSEIKGLLYELDFIAQTHKHLEDPKRWEQKIFGVLNKLTKINEEYLVDGKKINEEQKNSLYESYKELNL